MNELILVVDIQNDFLDGALGVCKTSEEKEEYLTKVVKYLKKRKKNLDVKIVSTQDTHMSAEKYKLTQEGTKLPMHHCEYGTEGHKIPDNVMQLVEKGVCKFNFALDPVTIKEIVETDSSLGQGYTRIEIFGIATDICVISNAFAMKQVAPETPIVIIEDLCLGTSEEAHQRAIDVLRGCQFEIEKSGV